MGASVSQTDIDAIRNEYAKNANVYPKSQVDTKFATIDGVYTKTASDAKYALADAVYNKSQSDSKYALLDSSYTKAASDAKYALVDAAYARAAADAKFATIDGVYTKAASDSRYEPTDFSYAKADSDKRYASSATLQTKLDELNTRFVPGIIDKNTTLTCNADGTCTFPPGKGTVLDFMEGHPKSTRKSKDNGTINFGKFDGGGSLNIVGAGPGDDRNIKLWGDVHHIQGQLKVPSIKIGSWTFYEEGGSGHLILQKDGKADAPDQGFTRFAPDGNLFLNRSSGRGWVADNIGGLTTAVNNKVNKNSRIGLRSSRGGYVSDQGGWKGKPSNDGDWETMYIEPF